MTRSAREGAPALPTLLLAAAMAAAPPLIPSGAALVGPFSTPATGKSTLFAQELPGEPDGPETAADTAGLPDLVTDRPDVTESTSIVAPGWVQAELGLVHEDAVGSTLAVPGTLLRIGVSPRVELRLGWTGWIDEDPGDCPAGADACGASGSGDGEAGLKILLVERSGARPDIAVLTGVSVPIGDESFTSDGLDPSLTALFANDLSDAVGWGANAGVAFVSPGPGADEDRSALFSWSWSFGFGLTERLGSFLEYFGESPEGEPSVHAADAGFTFGVTPDLQLDASAGVGLSDRAPDLFVGAGLSYRLAVF